MNALPPEGALHPENASASLAQRQDQVGAMCWRKNAQGREVLLVTSRDTGRWIIPKGWPIKSLGQSGSALLEAWEEAGVRGHASDQPIGTYDYDKMRTKGSVVPCRVAVFAVEVHRLADRFPEATQRRRRWFQPEEAAALVAEPELATLLRAMAKPSWPRPS
jgi:8-oxo-dGTP pyrophosphatase MutT (NUDIX family)